MDIINVIIHNVQTRSLEQCMVLTNSLRKSKVKDIFIVEKLQMISIDKN